MKKLFKLLVTTLMLIILIPICISLVIIPIGNNIKAWRFEQQLIKIQLPNHTELIEHKYLVGKINGNGNGINYLITMIIKSELSLSQLQNHYSNYKVAHQRSSHFDVSILEHGTISYNQLKNVDDYSNYYVVYSLESPAYGSLWYELDLRGH